MKYFSNFWKTLEIPLINCEINLILTWSDRCFIVNNPIDDQLLTFTITDTKLYVPVVTLSIQDNAKLLEQLKSGFNRTINRNKYESKVTVEQQNQYLDILINPSFEGVNRLFVLSVEDTNSWKSYKRYYLPLVGIKDYNVVIDGWNFFDQPVKNNLIIYDNIRKIGTGLGDDYATGSQLDCNYFDNYYKMIAIDLSKQQAVDVDPKTIQQINFTVNLNWAGNNNVLIIEEAKETV